MTDLSTKFSRYIARAAVKRQIRKTKNRTAAHHHIYLQTWLIIATACLFFGLIAYQNSLFDIMVATDKSYLSLLTILIFLIATGHAAWNITAISARIHAAAAYLDGNVDQSFEPAPVALSAHATIQLNDPPNQFIGNFVRDIKESVELSRTADDTDTDKHILEIYADQLRSPVEIGWFIVDILIRLGLIGTIVGFILILRSLVAGPLPTASEIQGLLISMSSGMGTALFTTLAGLTTATLLGLQYMVLSRSTESLIATLIRINQRVKV